MAEADRSGHRQLAPRKAGCRADAEPGRTVLSELSTIPRCSLCTYDEIWGRVAKDNYDNMKTLLDKISKNYESLILISHNQEVYDMCENHISIVKENNISKVVLK